MKINKNILIIGALGHWSRKTYLPLFKNSNYCGNLYLCDIKDCDLNLKNFNAEFVKISKECDDDLITLKNLIDAKNVKIVIISTPPEWHYYYLNNLKDCKVNFICDKPLISESSEDCNKSGRILKKYLDLYEYKKNEGYKIYSPLRRKLQSFYKKIYNEVSLIHQKFDQNITLITFYENDGCHRWDDEMEFDFAHGYSSGLGKLSHTGYHIIDIISELIKLGCSNIEKIRCEYTDVNFVGDNNKSKTNKIYQKLLGAVPKNVELKSLTKQAELDITLKYTIFYKDDIPSHFYLFLRHSGVSNRSTIQYSEENMGDQGRTDDSHFVIEQGGLQNINGTIIANSSPEGSYGESKLIIKRNINLEMILNKKSYEEFNVQNTKEKSTIDIVKDIVNSFEDKNIENKYASVEYDNQFLTMEMYSAALYCKDNHSAIEWEIGKLYDNLY